MESAIKIISDEKGWTTGNEKGAANYIDHLASANHGRFIEAWESDALKALALGAKAVLLGRLYIYGLAVAGEQGVREAVINFLADMDVTMGLCGIKACREIGPELLVKK